MKYLATFTLILLTIQLSAQKVQISPFIGYRVGGGIDVFYNNDFGSLEIVESESFGLDLTVVLPSDFKVSLAWYAQSTVTDFYGYGVGDYSRLGDTWVNYFIASGIYEKPVGRAKPFGGIGLGLATAQLTELDSDVLVRLAASMQAGVQLELSELLGVKFRAALLAPLQFGGGGLFCGIGTGGSGCSVSVGASSSILQGDFSAGLVLNIGGGSETSQKRSPASSPGW